MRNLSHIHVMYIDATCIFYDKFLILYIYAISKLVHVYYVCINDTCKVYLAYISVSTICRFKSHPTS